MDITAEEQVAIEDLRAAGVPASEAVSLATKQYESAHARKAAEADPNRTVTASEAAEMATNAVGKAMEAQRDQNARDGQAKAIEDAIIDRVKSNKHLKNANGLARDIATAVQSGLRNEDALTKAKTEAEFEVALYAHVDARVVERLKELGIEDESATDADLAAAAKAANDAALTSDGSGRSTQGDTKALGGEDMDDPQFGLGVNWPSQDTIDRQHNKDLKAFSKKHNVAMSDIAEM